MNDKTGVLETMDDNAQPAEVETDHADWVHGVSFDPSDGELYVTVSGHISTQDGKNMNLHVYDVRDNSRISRLDTEHEGGKQTFNDVLICLTSILIGVMDVTYSPCGNKLVTVSMDCYAHVFDVSGWKVLQKSSITLANIIRKIPTGHTNTVSYRTDLHEGDANYRLTHETQIYGVAYHPSGTFFGTVSADKTLKMWTCNREDVEAKGDEGQHANLIASVASRHTGRVRGIAYTNQDCITVSEDGCVCVTAVEDVDLFRLVSWLLHIAVCTM